MSSFLKVVSAIALLLAGVVGLLMSLCGGIFTFAGLTTQEMSGVFVISIPSLLGGAAIAWFATKKLRERMHRPVESADGCRPKATEPDRSSKTPL